MLEGKLDLDADVVAVVVAAVVGAVVAAQIDVLAAAVVELILAAMVHDFQCSVDIEKHFLAAVG